MDTILHFLYSVVGLFLPLLVSAFPLFAFVWLSRMPSVEKSVSRLALSTLSAVVIGLSSSQLAFWLSSSFLAHAIKGNGPKCVTGAIIYLMTGGLFTFLTFAIGLCKTIIAIRF